MDLTEAGSSVLEESKPKSPYTWIEAAACQIYLKAEADSPS